MVQRATPARHSKFVQSADISKTLVGMLCNSRQSHLDIAAQDWSIATGDLASNVPGRLATLIGAPYAHAIAVGINTAAPAAAALVEARAPGTSPLDERLYGLYSLAHLRALNPVAVAGSKSVALNAGGASTVQDETLMRLLCRCAMAGLDYSAVALSQSVAIAARNVGVSPVDERYPGAYSLAFVRGINSGAAAGSQGVAVEARSLRPGSADDFGSAATNYNLIVGAKLGAYIPAVGAAYYGLGGSAAASAGGSVVEQMNGLFVYQARESGFAAARRGKRFTATNSTMGLAVTGQLALVATTPTLMLRINSAAIRAIARSLSISLANTPGGVTTVIAVLDTLDRYFAVGTAVTPNNTNEESATAAVSLFYENPTATAAGVAPATRVLGHWTIPASVGSILDLEFEDSDLLGPTASTLLIYVYAPTTAPQIFYAMDFEEVA